jgi:uncharacterized Zn-finger protein
MGLTDDTIYVDSHKIACDGGGGALGHPKVFLDLNANDEIDCPYCGRHYVYKAAQAKRTPSKSGKEAA